MSRVRVDAFSISLDGFGAGPGQSLDAPLGAGGMTLHEWVFPTRAFRAQHGGDDAMSAPDPVDEAFAAGAMQNLGAWVMGRNMFGPVRGPWTDEAWRGWWGDTPPYHCDVFVLTHYARKPLEMQGGTVFHFVTTGFDDALARARESAGDKDIRIGGGVATVRTALQKRVVDRVHLAVAPVLLGRGEPLFEGLDLGALGYRVTEHTPSRAATHIVLTHED